MPKLAKLLLVVLFLADGRGASSQAATVFRGIPSAKITEGGIERRPEALTTDAAGNLACVVSRIGDKYYWASRKNTELVRVQAGAFITYIAVNGSGYIRIVAPGMKDAVSLMSGTEKQFDYIEHLTIGLRTITYYGLTRAFEPARRP